MKRRRIYLPLAVLLLSAAAYALGWSSLFTVSAIEIKGTNNYLPIEKLYISLLLKSCLPSKNKEI